MAVTSANSSSLVAQVDLKSDDIVQDTTEDLSPSTAMEVIAPSISAVDQILKRGRINFKLIEATNLTMKGQVNKKVKIDPFVRLKIGGKSKTQRQEKRSKTLKKCGGNVDFKNEMLHFDLVQPEEMVVDNDIIVKVSE